MGPAENNPDLSSTSLTNQASAIPKLSADGLNWLSYSERVMNYLTSKGLKRHLLGTTRKPVDLIERDGGYFAPRHLGPLSDAEFEKHEEEQDEYEQKQASVHEILYRTIDHSTFIQVKNEPNAKAVWNKIISIHTNKGNMYETNLLTQLQNSRFVEGENMREHLTKLTEIREKLSEIGCPISEESYIAYIRTSLSLAPNSHRKVQVLGVTEIAV